MLPVDAVLLYLNEYRSYMLAHTDGRRRTQHFLNQPKPDPNPRTPWDRLVHLAQTQHIDALNPPPPPTPPVASDTP